MTSYHLDNKYVTKVKAKVAIIIPFRDPVANGGPRTEQLKQIVSYFHAYMKTYENKVEKWKIFIAEQSKDGFKFNRGRLLNYAAKIAIKQGFDTLIFHDVDLLPSYLLHEWYISKPIKKIGYHIAKCWTERYGGLGFDTFASGIISVRVDDFIKADGFPNVYWGWGYEDVELGNRLMNNRVKIIGPTGKGLIKDLEEFVTHAQKKEKLFNVNKHIKCSVAWELNKLHAKNRNQDIKPSWWGLSGIKQINKIDITNSKYLQHSIYNIGLTNNFMIPVKTRSGYKNFLLNESAMYNFKINY
jgi:hypothetical protein